MDTSKWCNDRRGNLLRVGDRVRFDCSETVKPEIAKILNGRVGTIRALYPAMPYTCTFRGLDPEAKAILKEIGMIWFPVNQLRLEG